MGLGKVLTTRHRKIIPRDEISKQKASDLDILWYDISNEKDT